MTLHSPQIVALPPERARPTSRRNAMTRHGKDAHKRAARMLGFALTLDTEANWLDASTVWAARLSRGERAALLMAALHALDPDDATRVAGHVLGGVGCPMPTDLDPLEDALWWTARATPAELRAYAMSAFMALPRGEKHDFLEAAKGEVQA